MGSAEACSWKSLAVQLWKVGSTDALIDFLHDRVIGYLVLKKKNHDRLGRQWLVTYRNKMKLFERLKQSKDRMAWIFKNVNDV